MSQDVVSEVRTVAEVDKIVTNIKVIERMEPQAHQEEDALYLGILKAIANGTAENTVEMAKLAIKVEAMDFERWFE